MYMSEMRGSVKIAIGVLGVLGIIFLGLWSGVIGRAQTKQEVTFTSEQQALVKKMLAEQKAFNERSNQMIAGAIQQVMETTPDPDTGKPPLDPKKWQTAPTDDGGFKCIRISSNIPPPSQLQAPAPEGK